jgi:hypothetical protein
VHYPIGTLHRVSGVSGLSEPNLLTLARYSRAEKKHDDSTVPSETYIIGLCTGLFAATAIASSPSLSELVPIAVQVALMAFRTGGYVAALADRLRKDSESSESWTYVVPGAGETAATLMLDEFHNANVSAHRSCCRLYNLHIGNILIGDATG